MDFKYEYELRYYWGFVDTWKALSQMLAGMFVAHNVSDHAELMCGDIVLYLPCGLWSAHNECTV